MMTARLAIYIYADIYVYLFLPFTTKGQCNCPSRTGRACAGRCDPPKNICEYVCHPFIAVRTCSPRLIEQKLTSSFLSLSTKSVCAGFECNIQFAGCPNSTNNDKCLVQSSCDDGCVISNINCTAINLDACKVPADPPYVIMCTLVT